MSQWSKKGSFSRFMNNHIWLACIFLVGLTILFALQVMSSQIFFVSFFSVALFSVAFYLIGQKQVKVIERYQSLLEFLDIEESQDFEERNLFAHKIIYPSNIVDDAFEVVSYSRPVTYLGGDLHFQSRSLDGKYWFAIGDASGHDINAHLFSMMVISGLSSFVHTSSSPQEVNSKINEDLRLRSASLGHALPCYASLVILQSDSSGYIKHYGQHPNLILFRKSSNQTQVIQTSGSFIGKDHYPLSIHSETEPEDFQMETGDVLFVFTDGVFEQKNKENRYFGYKLYEYILNQSKENLNAFIENLFKEIDLFTEGEVKDDMTMMAIRKK